MKTCEFDLEVSFSKHTLLHSFQLDKNRVGLLEKHKITGKMHKFILSRAFIQEYKR
jgi:hypothetical protein